MSQPGGYQYQSYEDPNNSIKTRPPPVVNGQPNIAQHIQNGTQSPHYNLTGTPSSQSSRDPSREPSRDPSPTQYLHNQYRPQLTRPPMPPINGQQATNSGLLPPMPGMTQMQQYSPASPYSPNNNRSNSNAGPPNVVSPDQKTATSATSVPPPPPPNVQMSQGHMSQTPQKNHIPSVQGPPVQVSQPNASMASATEIRTSSTPVTNATGSRPGVTTNPSNTTQSYPWLTASQGVNSSTGGNTTSNIYSSANSLNSQLPISPAGPAPYNQNLRQPQQNVASSLQVQQVSQNSPANKQKQNVANYSPQNMNQNFVPSNSQSYQGGLPNATSPQSAPPYTPVSNVTSPQNPMSYPPNSKAATPQASPAYPPPPPKLSSQQTMLNSPQNLPSNVPNVPTYTQNVYGNSLQTQPPPPQLQAAPTSQNATGPQTYYSPQQKPPAQQIPPPGTQQNVYGGQSDSIGAEANSQQSQNMYGSQPNLASQRKYPQYPYGAQLPSNTASMPSSGMTPTRPGAPPTGPGQYQMRPSPRVPLHPGQQQQNQYDGRSPQYPGQMSNVPLDSMAKRYPSTYPDQMNQLNNQMSGMSVNQAGFNKLWGMESIDLLQCRNVLPAEKVEPPEIRLHQKFLDGINCSPDIFRCTLTKIPESNSLLQKSRLPLGILIHPFKDLNHLPVIQCSTIVRCRACRTYINPFVYFVDSKRWKCNLCYRVNEFPDEFQFDPVTKSYGDPSRRPEVKTSTIEFIAPSEYMLRPPQPAVYLFILDVSRLAVESGYLTVVCNTISEELSRLPGDTRTQVGFLAVDSAIHFYSMPDNVSQPHEMVMLDVDDIFLPCPDNLIVNLKEREELIRDLLTQLPTKFVGTHDTNCALGAGLQAAYKLMSPTGGRITVFQTCLPNLGPGLLQAREDPNNRASKDVPHLNPATDFYKRLALDCSGQQIAVDLFLLNSQYSDLATLSGMCKFSGGCIYHLPLFRSSKLESVEVLERTLRRYLVRKIGFEAVMRIRCTRGLSIHTFHGNFFVRSTDLLSLPNVNPDAGFGMQISIEENLSDIQSVCFQAALLYTSSKGERRIRVHTLCLPVASNLSDVLHSADQQCIIGLVSKMAVDRSQQSSLSDARDALINVAIDALSAYKLSQSVGPAGLLAPGSLKLLPLYIIGLLKCIAFRTGTSTRLDDRVFAMCQLKTLPLFQLIQMVYPDLYPIHALDDRNAKEVDGKTCPQPPRLHLSAEKLDSRGAFLMDAGDKMFIYVGKNIHPSFCSSVLGVSAFSSIPEEFYDLPELDTVESERLRNFVFSLQEEKPYYASVQIIRDDSHFRTLFTERLVEDRIESALSYYEFLQHLKTQVK